MQTTKEKTRTQLEYAGFGNEIVMVIHVQVVLV